MGIIEKKFYVPWANSSEWDAVRDQISSLDINQFKQAYETILMWKLKHYSLPAYVESTLSLLQVIIKEHILRSRTNNLALSILEEYDLQMACSMALIRFVNHVSSVGANKGESLYWYAKTQNIPDWIINMRHEAAHSQDLPRLEAFQAALMISLKWLLDNYWKKNNRTQKIKYNTKFTSDDLVIQGDVRTIDLFKKAFEIWNICSSSCHQMQVGSTKKAFMAHLEEFIDIKIKYFNEIQEDDIINLENFKKNFEDDVSSSQYAVKMKHFKSALHTFLHSAIKTESNRKFFIPALVQSSFLEDNNLAFRKWQKILQLVHKMKLLETLIIKLFQMTGHGHQKAYKWLVALYPSIKLLQKKWTMFKILRKENEGCERKKIIKQLQAINNNTKGKLLISFGLFKPPTITLDVMHELLMNPSSYQVKGVLQYLKIVKPALPLSTITLIKELMEIHEDEPREDLLSENDNIFTVDDLKGFVQQSSNSVSNPDVDECKQNDWKKSKIDVHTWATCSLGLLPFQTEVNCRISDNVTWSVSVEDRGITTLQRDLYCP